MPDDRAAGAADPPPSITCVDCGEDAHLLAVSEPDAAGDRIATYRCSGCMDRWDLVYGTDEDPSGGAGAGGLGAGGVDDRAIGTHGSGPEPPTPEGEISS